MHVILDALFRVLGGLGLLVCLTFVGKIIFKNPDILDHFTCFFVFWGILGFYRFQHLLPIYVLGYVLLWHTALKHLPPVQEAWGIRKPLKPSLESKREEIEALKQQHIKLMAPMNPKRNY